ncbi:hypothetical protein GTY81_02555 [Streptomyces sp. SID8366]|uniref:hypothetical protein n=1 Tax=unclassified Streptomyces TaxID=2593676 RepID=UPI000DB9881B|nr:MULTISPECIES: hypothetical protein [unclassified Streptomyces]MYU02796.1 hypothetical protein [Streptomyces sp. SID8366]MYU64523.1 hypothetical protein [Streptomyces sp. SID69]
MAELLSGYAAWRSSSEATEDRNHVNPCYSSGGLVWRLPSVATEDRNITGSRVIDKQTYGGGRPSGRPRIAT